MTNYTDLQLEGDGQDAGLHEVELLDVVLVRTRSFAMMRTAACDNNYNDALFICRIVYRNPVACGVDRGMVHSPSAQFWQSS